MIPRPWPEANCRWPVSVLLLQRFFWRLSDLQHCGVPPEEISMAFSEHLFSFPPGNHWATSKIQHYSALDVFWTLTSWCFNAITVNQANSCENACFVSPHGLGVADGVGSGPVAPWGGGPQARWDQRQGGGGSAASAAAREGCYFSPEKYGNFNGDFSDDYCCMWRLLLILILYTLTTITVVMVIVKHCYCYYNI